MVSYGNKYPRHNARPDVVEQSGQFAQALKLNLYSNTEVATLSSHFIFYTLASQASNLRLV